MPTIFMIAVLFFFSLVGPAQPVNFETADSLFTVHDWHSAKKIYEALLKDGANNPLEWNRLGFSDYHLQLYNDALTCFYRSLAQNPPAPLKAIVYSRLARIHARQNKKNQALTDLDSAVAAAYTNLQELDSLADFDPLRYENHFKDIRQKVYVFLYPCMTDPHARQFDFWIGEWNVYQTGTSIYQGHSLVQMIAGGCALLENWDSPNSTGKSINFIDPVSNQWKQSWAGSYSGGIQEFLHGKYEDSVMHFDFETTDAKGNKIIGRFKFYNEGPDQVRQFNETSADGGKTWITAYDFTYRRKNNK